MRSSSPRYVDNMNLLKKWLTFLEDGYPHGSNYTWNRHYVFSEDYFLQTRKYTTEGDLRNISSSIKVIWESVWYILVVC